MGKNQTIIINADVIATLKGMDKVVTGLKSGLSEANTKIDFTKGIGASVSKLVDKFKNEFSKFNQLTENGKLDIGNTKEALKSGKNLIDTYKELQRIIGDLNSLTVIDAKKLFPDAFDQRVENASKKLKDFSNNWSKISEKQLKLDQATTELQVLTDKLKELEKSLVDTNTLKVNTTSAEQKVEEMTNKVKELKNEFKKELKLKVDTIDKDLIKNKRNRDNLQEKLNRANSSGNINTAGRSVRYKGATLSEWEKGIGKASNASSQQKAGAIKALQNYSNITNELDAVNKKIKEQEKELENLKTGWASFDNIADEKLGKELAKMGFSTDEIAQIQKAMEATNVAISEQTNARQKLAEAETENARIEKEMSKTNSGITQKTQEIKQLEQAIENLKTKVGVEGLKKALKDALDIDISDDLLKSEQGLESLKNQLNELDNKSLSELIEKLSDMGINTEQAKQYVEQLTGTMVELGDSAKDINRANQEMEQLKNQVLQFFSIGNAVQLFKRAVKSAFDTVKELDATMTETAVVTDFTIGDMWKQLPTYTAEANKLGAAINDLYSSTTLYYQQGLQTKAAMALGIETTKMARIANIEAADATNLMTAALRGFNMELNETSAQKVNDIYSELAAITAADTQEIGVAMSKTASIASSANMELETTAALLSQIIETTREAPETAGTAMKTIIARFSEVKELISQGQLTGEDTEGEIIDVNKIQGALRSVGISMNEFFKGTEGLDDVLLKLASKWDTLDFTTQRYIATTAAGSRQQSRFIAMMSDYGRTQELVSAAYNSAGASQEQFEKTLDSLDAKLTKLKNAWDQFAMGLANNEFIKGAIDVLTGLLNTINSIIDGISGGNGLAKSVLSLGFAFSAFKLGKNFLGQIGAKLRMALGKGTEKDAQVAGKTIAQNLGAGIGKGIKSIKTKNLGNILLEKIGITKGRAIKGKDLTKTFGLDQLSNLDLGTKNAGNKLKASLFKQFKSLPDDIKGEMSNLDFGKILMNSSDLDSLKNAIPPEISKNLKMIGQDAKNAGGQLNKFSGNFKTVAAVAFTAGLALQGIASIMEEMGASEEAVNIVRTLGGVLMALGPIITLVGTIITAMGQTATATFTEMAAAAWNSLGPWGYILLAIVAVTTAFIALAAAIAATGQEAQIKKINEQISALSDEAQEARDAIDEISKEKSGLEELQDTFTNLTKGTTEWKQALVEINQQVLDLISKYPKLAQYVEKTESGSLGIKDEGWNDIIQGQKNKLNASLIAQASLQSKAAKLQQEIDYEKFFATNTGKQTKEFTKNNSDLIGSIVGSFIGSTKGIGGAALGSYVGNLMGKAIEKPFSEAIGSFTEWSTQAFLDIADFADTGWGKAIFGLINAGGGMLGTALGIGNATRTFSVGDLAERATTGGLTHDEFANFASALAEAGITNTAGMDKDEVFGIYTKLGFDPNNFDNIFQKIQNLGESFDELASSALAASIAEEAREQSMLTTIASNSDYLNRSEYSQQVQAITASQEDIQQKINDEVSNMGKSITDEMKQSYADITGQTIDSINAQIEDKSLSAETIKQTIATNKVTNELTSDMEELAKTLKYLESSANKSADGLKKFNAVANVLTYEGSGLTTEDIKTYSDVLIKKDDGSNKNYAELVDNEISVVENNIKKAIGADTYDKLIASGVELETIYNNIYLGTEQLDTALSKFSDYFDGSTLLNSFENLVSSNNLTAQQVQDFGNILIGVHGRGGNVQKTAELINNLINNPGLKEEDRNTAISLISTTDFSSKKSIEDTIEMLREMGAVIDDSVIIELENLAKSTRNLNFEELETKLSNLDNSIKTITDKIENEEVTFTKEEVDDLKSKGINTDDFIRTGIDEFTYIGSMNSLLESLDANVSNILGEMQSELSDKVANAEKIQEYIDKPVITKYKGEEYTQEEVLDFIINNEWDEEVFGKNSEYLQKMANDLGIVPEGEKAEDLNTAQLLNLIKTFLEENWGLEGKVAEDNITKFNNFKKNERELAYSNTAPNEIGNIDYFNQFLNTVRDENGAIKKEYQDKDAFDAEFEAYQKALDAAIVSEAGLYTELEKTTAAFKKQGREIPENTLKQLLINTRNAQKAEDKLNDTLNENIDAFKNAEKGGAAYNKALEKITNAAKKVFGEEITSDFIEKNRDLFIQLEKGGKIGENAFKQISRIVANDFLNSLNLADEQLLDIQNIISQLDGLDFSLTGTADCSDIFNQLNAVMGDAQKAAALLEKLGYEVSLEEDGVQWMQVGWKAKIINGIPYNARPDMKPVPKYKVEVKEKNGSGTNNWNGGGSKGGGGSGGGGGSDSKPDTKTWKNPYDQFYNTTEKINELLRDRNKLEREYDRLLSRNSTTVEQLNKNLEKQLKNLEDQIKSQKVLLSGKRRQLINAKNATMEVAEGRAISFQQKYQEAGGTGDISQYAYYDENLGQVVINWDKLEALQAKDAEQGEAVEAYISYLEGIAGDFEDAQDALSDIEDSITEIINQQLEERVDFIETMRDLLVEQYQKRIDELSSLNDTINDSNQKILDGISESIELERQIRDNTKTEEDIADKEARLAYLRRDTSGANDLEIMQLEEELANMREGYSDTLIDQEIDRLARQNDEAAEARQRQIEIMQAQLDYWQSSDYFNNLIESMDKNEATALWKELKDFEYKTEAEKIALMKEFNEFWNRGSAGSKELAAADSMYQGTQYTLTDAKGNTYTVSWNGTAWVGTDKNGNTFSISQSDIDGANIDDKTLTTSLDLTNGNPGGGGEGGTGGSTQPTETYPYGKASETSGNIKQGAKGNAVKAIQYALNKLGYGNSGTSSVDGIFGPKTTEAVKAFQKAMDIKQDGIVGNRTREKFRAKQYLTGGLADYTGLAWLDGSKSKPELVLNAKDTENFITLKDILSDVLKGGLSRTKNSGDNYYDFHITIEEIANDYDVEKMIQKIKEEINNDARYRNVNAINLLR